MKPEDEFRLAIDSDSFRIVCKHLDTAVLNDQATWAYDVLSGGFKFSDEVPKCAGESQQVVLPLVTLLRYLWAFRLSLVEGTPRAELSPYWHAAAALAPQWAGFAASRCSTAMTPMLIEIKSREDQYAKDIEQLENRLRP